MKTIITYYQDLNITIQSSEAGFISQWGGNNLKSAVANFMYEANLPANKCRASILVVGRTVESVHKTAYFGKSLLPKEAIRDLKRVREQADKGYEMSCLVSSEFATYDEEWVEEEQERIRTKYGISKTVWEREVNY